MVSRKRRQGSPPLTLLLALTVLPLLSTVPPMLAAAPATPDRPKIALVLGGGGARGGAHIGVIEVLEKHRVPIDIIVGTSMGSIVGGLYASGYSPTVLTAVLNGVPWGDIFTDAPPRKDLSFRRKEDDEDFLVKGDLGIGSDGLRLPRGLLQGQQLKLFLKRSTLHVAHIHDFDQLSIPFRAVASDIAAGTFKAFDHGDLAESMSASMSVPAILAPVTIDGRLFVDGGVTNNLAIDVAQSLGADIIIAVDVGTPLAGADELESLLDITGQLTTMLTRTNADIRRKMLGPNDILIVPPLGDIGSADFDRTLEAVEIGRAATEAQAVALSALSLSESAFEAHVSTLRRDPVDHLSAEEIAIASEGPSESDRKYMLNRMRVKPEPELPVDVLEQGIGRIYGLGLFEEVTYRETEERVDVRPRLKSWGPNFLRLGVNMSGDFSGRSDFSLGVRVTATNLNFPGAEWRNELSIGRDARIFSEFYQPFRALGFGFFAPSIEAKAFNFGLYEDEDLLADYRIRGILGTLAVGLELSNWGEIRTGIRKGTAASDRLVGDPGLENPDDDLGLFLVNLTIDTLDNVYFPGAGQRHRFKWRKSETALGGGSSYQLASFDSIFATTHGRHHYILAAKGGSVYDGTANVLQAFNLGGFLNLSGLEPDQLNGQQMFLGRLVYFRQMTRSLFLPSYLGASFEMGEVWQDQDDVSPSDLRAAGSAFIGFDTILGPLYLGGGWAEGGDRSLYVSLGSAF